MANPLTFLAVIALTSTVVAMIGGEELAQESFPEFDEPDSGGFWGSLDALVSVVQGIWGVVVYLFNLLTFNIGGAPWWIRVPVGAINGGGLLWSIATLIRGGGD